ncbi:MAG: efflux RND transporter periplasmic adaptor subunit [Luteolibacter sp.]
MHNSVDPSSLLFPKVSLLLALSLAVLSMNSCRQADAASTTETSPEEPTVPVIRPQVTEVPYDLSFVADIRSSAHFPLKANTGGVVEKVLVEEGARVKKGQHLFTVAGREIETDLAKSKAERAGDEADVKVARIELKNTQALYDKKIVSQTELDMAVAKLDSALAKVQQSDAEVAQNELKLEYALVTAPADGVISRIPHRAGSRVDEGEDLTEFSQDGDMQAYFYVSEKDYFSLVKNTRFFEEGAATLELADGSRYPLQGKVDSRDTMVTKETGSIAFRACFPNPEGILKEGASGRITLRAKVPDAMVIPQRSTFEVQHKLCVYLLGDDNVVRMRTIVPSFRFANSFVVASGLQPNDRVVYEGIQLVKDGEKALAASSETSLPPAL